MNEDEQDGLMEEAKRLMEEAIGEFLDGDIGRATDLAFEAYTKAKLVQDANPTPSAGIRALVSLAEDLSAQGRVMSGVSYTASVASPPSEVADEVAHFKFPEPEKDDARG